jgi:hypothetical protein
VSIRAEVHVRRLDVSTGAICVCCVILHFARSERQIAAQMIRRGDERDHVRINVPRLEPKASYQPALSLNVVKWQLLIPHLRASPQALQKQAGLARR